MPDTDKRDGPVFAAAPRRVYWEVTRACDLACRHCRAAAAPLADPAELDARQAVELLDRLAGFGAPLPDLVLTGGDPLKRTDLFSLIDHARGAGFPVSVAPSATPLLTAGAVRRLHAAGVGAISLSVDGSDAERHDALRGVRGCFERTLAAAREARAAGLAFQVNTLASRETLPDLPAIYEVASALGAARWSLFFLVAVGRGALLEPIPAVECEQLFERLVELAGRGGPLVTTTEAPHFRRVVAQRARGAAGAPRGSTRTAAGIRDGNGIMFVSHTGMVYPSGFFPTPAGHALRDDPVEVYRHAPLFRALRRSDLFGGRCGRCEFRGLCGGSRARALVATGDPLAEDPLCSWQPRERAGVARAAVQ